MIPVTVTFYGDVGFDRSYNHVIDFSDETERSNYFSNKVLKTVQNCAYNKPINTIQLKCPYEEALNFTYCKFVMGSNPNSQKTIYAWVDDVVLVTDQLSTTLEQFIPIIEISISVDPWQTFLFDFTLGESFVAREHVDRFKSNLDGTYGWCLPNTTDRNNIGLETRFSKISNFVTSSSLYKWTKDGTVGTAVNKRIHWILIQGITSGNTPKQVLYLVPFCDDRYCIGYWDSSAVFHWGATLTVEDIYTGDYLNVLGIDPEKTINISFIPIDCSVSAGERDVEYDGDIYKCLISNILFDNFVPADFHNPAPRDDLIIFSYDIEGKDLPLIIGRTAVTLNSIGLVIPSNNDDYSPTHEPQLYKQPYRYISVVANNGEDKAILPDIIANSYIENQPIRLGLYLLVDSTDVKIRIVTKLNNDYKNMCSDYWVEFPLVSVDVNSSHWFSYMVQQRDADRSMIATQAVQGAIATAIGGVSSAVTMGGQEAYGIRKAQALGNAGNLSASGGFKQVAGIGLGAAGIGTVGGFATGTAFGFIEQDIRESAIKRKANSIISAGTFKSMVNDELAFYLIHCDKTSFDIKSKEFHKYGYSVFKYETPDVKTRKYFNYIATTLVKIEGSLNNNVKMALSEIFNNGVTIWHGDYISDLTGIGDYSKENIERSLI